MTFEKKILKSLKENMDDWQGRLYGVKMLLFPHSQNRSNRNPTGAFKEMIQVEP